MSEGNYDAFRGHPLTGPGVVASNPLDPQTQIGGMITPVTDDPAWQAPTDPLAAGADVPGAAKLIFREIPNVNVQHGWSIAQIRIALIALSAGNFDLPAQLVDALFSDSRIQASLASINGGLFSRPITWEIPPGLENDEQAIACLAAWQDAWPGIGTEAALSDAMAWDVLLGFWCAQILWDTSGDVWIPQISPWHARYTYYHWTLRRLIASTMDGQVVIEPGDGKWIFHAPHGEYRGWMRGAIRSVSPWCSATRPATPNVTAFRSRRHGPRSVRTRSRSTISATRSAGSAKRRSHSYRARQIQKSVSTISNTSRRKTSRGRCSSS
jgi:hypothetical protein